MRAEFDDLSYPGFAWVTDGRTIENYVPTDILTAALEKVHPSQSLVYAGDKWANPLEVASGGRVDKIKLALAASAQWPADRLDQGVLRAKVRQTVRFIHEANGTEPSDLFKDAIRVKR